MTQNWMMQMTTGKIMVPRCSIELLFSFRLRHIWETFMLNGKCYAFGIFLVSMFPETFIFVGFGFLRMIPGACDHK